MARLIRPDGEVINHVPHRNVDDMVRALGCNVELIRFNKRVQYDDEQPQYVEFFAFVDVDRETKELPINEKATLIVEQEIRGSAIITSDSEMSDK